MTADVDRRGRLLGVDYGTVRVGLAISDADRCIASPLGTIPRRSAKADADYFRALASQENVVGLVVGLPVHTDGREGVKARAARGYGTWLNQVTGLPVAYWDERFSSVEAERHLWAAGLTHRRRKERRDQVAAQITLQAYLDAGCPVGRTPGPLTEGTAEP